jgi:dihydroorotase
MATTMSKFLYLGLSLPQVVEMTTATPARSVRMAGDIGTLRPGASADVTLLELRPGPVALTDASEHERETVIADQALVAVGAVRAGKVVFFSSEASAPSALSA